MFILFWRGSCFDLWNSVRLIKSRPSPTSKGDVGTKPKRRCHETPNSPLVEPHHEARTSAHHWGLNQWHDQTPDLFIDSYCPKNFNTFQVSWRFFLGGAKVMDPFLEGRPKFSKVTINGSQLGTRLLSSLSARGDSAVWVPLLSTDNAP